MARFDQYYENIKINNYIATSLQMIPQNKCLQKTLVEVLFDKPDNRTGDEIAMDIIVRAGLSFGE